MRIKRAHFKMAPDSSRPLFAASVKTIEIEVSSYCNRVCSYCPNSFIDRRSSKHKMSDALFSSIIQQLSSINWAGSLRFHRYNEPLEDREYILSRLREARGSLPHAELVIFTNGDYLDREYLQELYAAGCRTVLVTLHAAGEDFNLVKATEILEGRVKKLGYPYEVSVAESSVSATVSVYRDFVLSYHAQNFNGSIDGLPVRYDRGQSLPTGDRVLQRLAACYIPFTEMQIELDGTLLPCCHIRSDVPSHQSYVLGKLEPDSNLFLAWTNSNYVAWRKSLVNYGPKSPPCSSCHYNMKIHTRDKIILFIRNLIHFMSGRSPEYAVTHT